MLTWVVCTKDILKLELAPGRSGCVHAAQMRVLQVVGQAEELHDLDGVPSHILSQTEVLRVPGLERLDEVGRRANHHLAFLSQGRVQGRC